MAKPARLADNLAWKRRDDRSPRHRPSPTDAPPGFSGSGRASAGRRTAAICMHGIVLVLGRPSLGGPVLYGPGSPERGACSPVDRCGTRRWGRGSTRSRGRGRGFRALLSRLRRRGSTARRPRTRSAAGGGPPDRRASGKRPFLAAAAGAVALREPLITGRLLARRLGVSARTGLDLAARLVAAGVLREMTGRTAWRAFAIA
jgi:HTH DNA binding domain